MRVFVHPLPKPLESEVCVLIDVLRATCTISAALSNGATGVRPVKDVEEALRYKGKALLAGERNSVKIKGFDLGNSPSDMVEVFGREIVLSTTNGTKALSMMRCSTVVAASFPNLSAVVDFLSPFDRIDVVCAGDNGEISLEDFLLAGRIAELDDDPKDTARIATLYSKSVKDVQSEILKSSHARRLLELGFSEDVEFCSAVDTLSVVPVLKDGVFRRLIL